uniref:Uncharacterized protein n=1 Tax=Photinus pyralis TaxID=7054 RepID=A0A1Y1LA25_PHOPY
MYLFIHTVTITESDCIIEAQIFHTLDDNNPMGKECFRLLGRRLRLKIHKNLGSNRQKFYLNRMDASNLRLLMKRNVSNIKHHMRTIHIETTNIHNRQANQMQIQNDEAALVKYNQQKLSPAHSNENSYSVNNNNNNVYISEHLLPGSNPQLTAHWLNTNRFDKYVPIFANFGGADMLRMSRDDLIQICGQADGIRLYNVLHAKTITPKLTIYIGRENTPVFNAIFLSSYTSVELMQKLAALTGVPGDKVSDIYMNGPQAIHVQLSNDVIRHIKEETMFSLEILQDNGNYIFVLKPYIK